MSDRDEQVERIERALEAYGDQHPNAVVEVRRRSLYSIRIRVTDPDFAGQDRVERDREVWPFLESLDEDVRADITMLLLITPEEKETSLASREFDDPLPSRL